jgi:hypothetical protein
MRPVSGKLVTFLHSLRPPQKIRTQPSRYCGANPFCLMILYRDHVLIGCLFDSPLVSKLQTASRKNHRLAVATSTVSYQQPSCSSLQLGARSRSASECLTSSPSVKIETRFYPFVLTSGRIEWLVNAHTKSGTLTSESLSVKHVYIMTKAAFGVQKLHLCIFKYFPLLSLFAFCPSCCTSLSFSSSPVCWQTFVDSNSSLVQYLFHSSTSPA